MASRDSVGLRARTEDGATNMSEVLEPLIDLVREYGVWMVFVLMFVENLFPPIPSELVMLNAGLLVAMGDATLPAVIIAGVAGSMVGAFLWYAVGRYFGRDLIVHHGRRLRIRPSDIEKGEAWFERRGGWAVFIGRVIPIVRTFVSVPAGVARMRLSTFTIFSLAGTIIWTTFLAVVGREVGERTRNVERGAGDLLLWIDRFQLLVIAVLAGGFVWLVAYLARRRRRAAI